MDEMFDLSRALKQLSGSVIDKAGARALNRRAGATMLAAQRGLPAIMTIRNAWTARSISHTRASSSASVGEQFVYVGSPLAYLAQLEEGFTRRPSDGVKTTASSGEGQGDKRRKIVRRKNAIDRLIKDDSEARAKKKRPPKSRKGKFRAAIEAAKAAGVKTVRITPGDHSDGYYRVAGRAITMVRAMTDRTMRVAPRPWLMAAAAKGAREADPYFAQELHEELRANRAMAKLRRGR